jgi:uncharacterized protein (UPF0305 family)
MSFYTPEEEKHRHEYIPIIRKRILERIEDLKTKIENDEDFPHGKQNIDTLVQIDDNIEDCLNNWYY